MQDGSIFARDSGDELDVKMKIKKSETKDQKNEFHASIIDLTKTRINGRSSS